MWKFTEEPVDWGEGKTDDNGTQGSWRVLNVFVILIVVMVSQVYTYVIKLYTLYVGSFIVHQFYFN